MTHYFIHFQEPENTSFSLFDLYEVPKRIEADPNLTLRLFQIATANRMQKNPEEYYYLHGAFDMLIAPFFSQAEQKHTKNPQLLEVLEYIHSHIEQDIQISDLADITNLSVNHFSHIFKKTFGLSPKKYILQKKFNYAQTLLAESNLHVNEISYKLGFNSETYFSRLFREKIGISPSEYKKQLTQSMQNF